MERKAKPENEPTIKELREAQEDAMMRAMYSPPPPPPPPLLPPVMPDGLTEAQAMVWERFIPLLEGRISAKDADALTDLCYWTAEMERIHAEIKTMSVRDKDYERMQRIAANATAKFQSYAERYGLCPKK